MSGKAVNSDKTLNSFTEDDSVAAKSCGVNKTAKRVSLILCCIFFFSIGVLHFTSTPTFTRIVPDFIPFPEWAVYITGVMEMCGAVFLYFPRSRRLASYFLIFLLVIVFPANINMAVNHIDFGKIPTLVLWSRLPLQAVLIYWVYQLRRKDF